MEEDGAIYEEERQIWFSVGGDVDDFIFFDAAQPQKNILRAVSPGGCFFAQMVYYWCNSGGSNRPSRRRFGSIISRPIWNCSEPLRWPKSP